MEIIRLPSKKYEVCWMNTASEAIVQGNWFTFQSWCVPYLKCKMWGKQTTTFSLMTSVEGTISSSYFHSVIFIFTFQFLLVAYNNLVLFISIKILISVKLPPKKWVKLQEQVSTKKTFNSYILIFNLLPLLKFSRALKKFQRFFKKLQI